VIFLKECQGVFGRLTRSRECVTFKMSNCIYQRELGEIQAERAGDLPPTVLPDLGNASVGMGQGDSYTLLGEVRVSPPYTLRYAVFYCFRFCEARRFKTPFQQTEKTMPSPSDQAETDRLLVTEGSRSSSPCWCRLKFNRRR